MHHYQLGPCHLCIIINWVHATNIAPKSKLRFNSFSKFPFGSKESAVYSVFEIPLLPKSKNRSHPLERNLLQQQNSASAAHTLCPASGLPQCQPRCAQTLAWATATNSAQQCYQLDWKSVINWVGKVINWVKQRMPNSTIMGTPRCKQLRGILPCSISAPWAGSQIGCA